MTILDFILVIIISCFVFSGLRFGLIHALGALIGTIAGALIAGHYFDQFGHTLNAVFLGNLNLARIFAFIIIFIVVSHLVGFIFWLLDRIFHVISIIPFLKSINRLAGGILGFFEGTIVSGLILIVVAKFPFAGFIVPAMEGSNVAKWLMDFGKILLPLLPEIIKQVKSAVVF